MKHIFLIVLITGLAFLTQAQKGYEVSTDGTNKILKGAVSRDMLENDTAFKWYHENEVGYIPNTATVSVLKARAPEVQFIVFGGTWCEDTQKLLPKFFLLMDAAGIPGGQVQFIGVDRHKKSIDQLPEEMHLTSTPTFIVLKDGKEVGRVVEYGKSGNWENELANIVSTKF